MNAPFARRAVHWLVTDGNRPPATTETDVTAQRRAAMRWNRIFHTADGAIYWAGINAVSYNTIIPLFVSKLTDSPLLIGLVAVFSQAGWYLPQLFTAGATERIGYKRPIVVRLGFLVERVPVLLWPIAALLSLRAPETALTIFLVAFGAHFFGAGIVAPAWQDLIAHTFALRVRGRFFGLTTFLGTSLGAVGGALSGRVLGAYRFPFDFAIAFACAAVCVQLSWVFLAVTKEPPRIVESTDTAATDVPVRLPQRRASYAALRALLQEDREFAQFLLVRTFMGLGTLGFGFVAFYAVGTFGLSDTTIALFTVAMLIGEALGNISAGHIADQRGHRVPLVNASVCVTLAFTIVWLANAPAWFYPAFFLMGYAIGAGRVSAMMIAIEYAPQSRTPTYVGVTNTLAGAGGLVAPLLGAALAATSYRALFAVAAAVNLFVVAGLLFVVNDPRTLRRARH